MKTKEEENTSWRRVVLLLFSFVTASLASGVVFGWPQLRQLLIEDGGDNALSEAQLGLAFTAGSWSTQGGRFLAGMARDRVGTRVVAFVSLLAAASGFLGIGLLNADSSASVAVSMFVVGLGSGIHLCAIPVASLFPDHAGSVQSSLVGAFQLSGLVFLVLKSIPASRKVTYVAFSAIIFVSAFLALFVMPKGVSFLAARPTDQPDRASGVGNDDTAEIEGATIGTSGAFPVDTSGEKDNEVGGTMDRKREELEGKSQSGSQRENEDIRSSSKSKDEMITDREEISVLTQLLSKEYCLLLLWFSLQVIPIQYYVGSIGFQLEEKGDDDGFYANLYSIIYGSFSLLSPVVGYFADTFGLGAGQAVGTCFSAVSFLVIAMDVPLNTQIVSLVCSVLARMIVYGLFFAHIGIRFGFRNYGTLAGLGLLISAIFGLIQAPMIAAAADGHTRLVNIISGVSTLATLPYCVWLSRREHTPGVDVCS